MSKGSKQDTAPTVKKMFIDEFCSKFGCTPQQKFYLSKLYKGGEFSETDWKKKLEDGNKN